MSRLGEPGRLLTIAQAAEITSYPESVIRSWIAAGLPHISGAGGRKRPRYKDIRIKSSDLWDWIDGTLRVSRRPSGEEPRAGQGGRPVPKVAAGDGGLMERWKARRAAK